MLDLTKITKDKASVWLAHMISVAVATEDNGDYLDHYNMTISCGNKSVMHNMTLDPTLSQMMNIRMQGYDFEVGTEFITEPGEVLDPSPIGHFLFLHTDHNPEPLDSPKLMFLMRLHTLKHIMDDSYAVAWHNMVMGGTTDNYLRRLVNNYDAIRDSVSRSLKTGHVIRLSFNSVVE